MIWLSTKEEHYRCLRLVFDSLKRVGLKLNRSKCVFVATVLLYLGHILTSEGIKPDPSKVTAVFNMPVPQCKEGLQRFLGMTHYLCKSLPQYSEVTAPLCKLLKKEVHWHFEKPQLEAIKKLKEMTTNSPVLQLYDPSKPTRLTTDASRNGLGDILKQQHDEHVKPVIYASQVLQPEEKDFCPLEKETLSIVFYWSKSHDCLYSCHFEVNNDHKPLHQVFKKSTLKAPPRVHKTLVSIPTLLLRLRLCPRQNCCC